MTYETLEERTIDLKCPECGHFPLVTKPPHLKCRKCQTEFKLVVK